MHDDGSQTHAPLEQCSPLPHDPVAHVPPHPSLPPQTAAAHAGVQAGAASGVGAAASAAPASSLVELASSVIVGTAASSCGAEVSVSPSFVAEASVAASIGDEASTPSEGLAGSETMPPVRVAVSWPVAHPTVAMIQANPATSAIRPIVPPAADPAASVPGAIDVPPGSAAIPLPRNVTRLRRRRPRGRQGRWGSAPLAHSADRRCTSVEERLLGNAALDFDHPGPFAPRRRARSPMASLVLSTRNGG